MRDVSTLTFGALLAAFIVRNCSNVRDPYELQISGLRTTVTETHYVSGKKPTASRREKIAE